VEGLFKSAVRRGLVGFALGLLAGAGILRLANPGAFAEGGEAFFAHLLAGGVYGAVVMACTVAYDMERWSVTRATLAHLCVTLGGMYVLGLVQGWLRPTLIGFVVPTLGCVGVYILIWLVLWLSYRDKIRRMNRGMKDWKTLKNRTLEE